ncbi:MAG: DNA-protecting protein DprA, partial [Spirochaetaceae bacterium]|nr:DNA-protecting protein DprA [Spirochaetaceae bacterium]
VISGLAAGIDAMAHRGCIEGFAATYAVFGSSPDEVYPASNRQLAQRILQHNGALISEYPPQTHPSKWTFPARNRIISGLSSLVLVVQAGKKSGALITADFALDQGRELAVAASPCGHVFGEGCEKLAADGAPLIKSAEDILSALNISPQIAPRENPPASLAGRLAEEFDLRQDT